MKISTSDRLLKALSIVFWLSVWQIAALLIGEELFLPSPAAVLSRLISISSEPVFWSSIAFSLSRISLGFFLSLLSALVLSFLSYKAKAVRILLEPLVKMIKATPVASIVILALVWIRSRNLSVVISFLMVFPVVYTNMLEGLDSLDRSLVEMADVYSIRGIRRFRYILLPSLTPYYESALKLGLGLCWKSGIAAEVISMPSGSIGERLYEAKIYLSTPDLFAWTVTIVLLAFIFEKAFLRASLFLIDKGCGR